MSSFPIRAIHTVSSLPTAVFVLASQEVLSTYAIQDYALVEYSR